MRALVVDGVEFAHELLDQDLTFGVALKDELAVFQIGFFNARVYRSRGDFERVSRICGFDGGRTAQVLRFRGKHFTIQYG